jgi:uncharacterized membrane protein
LWRFLVLWFVIGMCYATVELLYRGYTYVQMIWIGGLAGVLIGLLDCHPAYYNRRMWQQCFLGTLIALAIECGSGLILNRWLHLHIWDYSCLRYNFRGQICLRAAVAWFFLMPFAIYLDDWLRWKLFSEPKPAGGILHNYGLLFRGK